MRTNKYRYRETPQGFPVYMRVKGEGMVFYQFCRTRQEARTLVYRLNGWKG